MEKRKSSSSLVARYEALATSEKSALEAEEATTNRRAVARINYMSQDRTDMTVCSRRLAQGMSELCQSDENTMKRVPVI